MTTQRNAYQPFFAYLRSLNFHFLDTWVIECVNYYKSSNPNISLEVLKNEVKQQWLLVNLREIKVPSLPPNLKSIEKIILNGTYAVQVESMLDSSESCYSQFQKLQKISTENVQATKQPKEWNIQSKRCLTFVMCDGVQEIQAMEYQPIKKLRINDPELLPGFKMVIIGPVECRKGMILLKDENVRVWGGEVDALTVSNTLKSLLIKRLELDESDFLNEASLDCLKYESEIPQPLSDVEGNVDNLDEGCIESLLSQNDDLFLSLPLETEIIAEEPKSNSVVNTTINVSGIKNYSEITNYWNEETSQFNEITKHKKHSLPQDVPTSTQKRLSLDPALSNKEDKSEWNKMTRTEVDFDDVKDLFIEDVIEPQVKVISGALKTKKPVQTKLSSYFKNSDSCIDSVESTLFDFQTSLFDSDKPFVYLKQIISADTNRCDIFTIKGIILTLKKKITIENDKFNLKANVTDGSASMDVEFSSGILEELLGYSPCEMTVMMKARQTNSAIAQRIKESFTKAQEKLISLNCLMEIKFFTDNRSPLILSLQEVGIEDLNALKKRKLREV